MLQQLDINRYIDRIRAQPGRNFDALAYKAIQDFVNRLEVVTTVTPTPRPTLVTSTGGGTTPAPTTQIFTLSVNGQVSPNNAGNFNNALPVGAADRMLGQWLIDPTVTPANIAVNFPNIGGVDARTTITETISLSSQGKLVTFSHSGTVTVTLDSTVSGTFFCYVKSIGTGTLVLTPSSGQINGAGTASIAAQQGAIVFFDGTNWWAVSGSPTLPTYADAETPTDSGDHQHFTLAHAPNPATSLQLNLKGTIYPNQPLFPAGSDYSLSGSSITTNAALVTPFTLLAWYRY